MIVAGLAVEPVRIDTVKLTSPACLRFALGLKAVAVPVAISQAGEEGLWGKLNSEL